MYAISERYLGPRDEELPERMPAFPRGRGRRACNAPRARASIMSTIPAASAAGRAQDAEQDRSIQEVQAIHAMDQRAVERRGLTPIGERYLGPR